MSISFYGCVSLDGYLADSEHDLTWLFESGSPEETSYQAFYDSLDITIMGKQTFKEIEKLDSPKNAYSTTTNYVFTHDSKFNEEGFIPVQGDVVDFVKGLDQEKHIWVVGGNQILAPLLEANLVDQLIIQVAPVLLGEGIPLFTQKKETKRFHLAEVTQFGQFAEMRYTK